MRKEFLLTIRHPFFYIQSSFIFLTIIIYFIIGLTPLSDNMTTISDKLTGLSANTLKTLLLIFYTSISLSFHMIFYERKGILSYRFFKIPIKNIISDKIIISSLYSIFFSQIIYWGYILIHKLHLYFDIEFLVYLSMLIILIIPPVSGINICFSTIGKSFFRKFSFSGRYFYISFFITFSLLMYYYLIFKEALIVYAYYKMRQIGLIYPNHAVITSLLVLFAISMIVTGITAYISKKSLDYTIKNIH